MYFYYVGKYTKKTHNNYINLQKITQNSKSFEKQLENILKDKVYTMKYYDMIDETEVEKTIDITYKNLPDKVKRKLDYTTITVIEISIDDERLRERLVLCQENGHYKQRFSS